MWDYYYHKKRKMLERLEKELSPYLVENGFFPFWTEWKLNREDTKKLKQAIKKTKELLKRDGYLSGRKSK